MILRPEPPRAAAPAGEVVLLQVERFALSLFRMSTNIRPAFPLHLLRPSVSISSPASSGRRQRLSFLNVIWMLVVGGGQRKGRGSRNMPETIGLQEQQIDPDGSFCRRLLLRQDQMKWRHRSGRGLMTSAEA